MYLHLLFETDAGIVLIGEGSIAHGLEALQGLKLHIVRPPDDDIAAPLRGQGRSDVRNAAGHLGQNLGSAGGRLLWEKLGVGHIGAGEDREDGSHNDGNGVRRAPKPRVATDRQPTLVETDRRHFAIAWIARMPIDPW